MLRIFQSEHCWRSQVLFISQGRTVYCTKLMEFGAAESMSSIKFVSSSSAATGQNAILGKGSGGQSSLVQGKFGKAKTERQSPSVERQKAEADSNPEEELKARLDMLGSTPGMTQADKAAADKAEAEDELMALEQKAAEDAKRHKRAIEGGDGEGGRTKEEQAAAELWSWRKDLDVEKEKRRSIEDQLDDLKLEVSYNRESCAKATHVVAKLVTAQLQESEKCDQTTIMVVKKKSEKMKPFFESYKALQTIVAKEANLVSVANNGPMLSIKVVAPEKVREAMNVIHGWQRDERVDVAVFRGKTALTQMMELPIRGAHRAMLNQMGMDARQAKEAGLTTCWMDQEKRWSICLHDVCHIRGQMNMQTLEAEVQITLEHFTEQGYEKVVADMKAFEAGDRSGCLFEQSFSKQEQFAKSGPNVHVWGRQSKGGKGGKGSGKHS